MTRQSILVAVGGSAWESELVARLSHPVAGLTVAARCADVTELLAVAPTGVAQAVLVSSELSGLDRDVLARMAALGLVVIGLAPTRDEHAERRLRQLGVSQVHVAGAAMSDLVAALTSPPGREPAGAAGREPAFAFANPFSAVSVPVAPVGDEDEGPGPGRVVAVWGPTGAPGRSTVALGLAAELALLGWPTLLVDADVYGGTLARTLGLRDESAGFAAACRRANAGVLDAAALAELVQPVSAGFGVLTGIRRAERWPELRPAAVEGVLALARRRAAVTVVDCAFALEQDEELSYDTLAPRRNGATLAVLADADLVVAVGAGDHIGLDRLVGGLAELREAVPDARTAVVVNRVREGLLPESEVRWLLRRHADVDRVACLPLDVEAVDGAARSGAALAVPASPLRVALQAFATALVSAPRAPGSTAARS